MIRRNLPLLTVTLAALSLAVGCQRTTDPRIEGPRVLLTDFSTDLPSGDANTIVALTFEDIRPMPGGGDGNVTVQLRRTQGRWAGDGHTASANYNQAGKNEVTLKDVTWEGNRITGSLAVTIGWDHPRSRREKGFPNPPDEYLIEFAATIQHGQTVPFRRDVEAFLPSYRKDTPRYGGTLVTGSYTAVRGKVKTRGDLLGGVSPARAVGQFAPRGNVVIAPADGGGMRLAVKLSPTRVAPPSSGWAVKRFAEPLDLSDHSAILLTVSSRKARSDAAVAVGFAEQGGGFYSVTSAARLTGGERTFRIPLKDFRGGSDNYHFDREKIAAIFIGVDNPHGVGTVEFSVRRVELHGNAQGVTHPQTPTLTVSPAVELNIDGTRDVPKGLFGFHDVWHAQPRTKGQELTPPEYMRRINPGYLRPLDHVGFSGRARGAEASQSGAVKKTARSIADGTPFYRRAVAANATDNIVYCHTMDLWARPVWMDTPIDAIARDVEQFYNGLGKIAWRPGDRNNLLRRLEVWNEPFMWARHVNMGFRNPPGKKAWTDPTQHGYLPAKLITDQYATLFEAAHRGAKRANKHVLLGGPCSPSMNGDDYSVFTKHVRPFLDRCGHKADFLTEHHYFGNPAAYAASYIVATAYMDTALGRRLPIYNTECNDLSNSDIRRAFYNVSEILHEIRRCPDILKGRAVHALWGGYLRNTGEEHAYRLLSTLRGRMLPCTQPVGMSAVAVRTEDGHIVLVVHNESGREQAFNLNVPGWDIVEQLALRVDGDKTSLEPRDSNNTPRLGHMETLRFTLKPIEKDDEKKTAEPATLSRTTHYADVTCRRVTPGKAVAGKIHYRSRLDQAETAFLRLVTRGVHRGEGVVVIGEETIPLPWSSSNDGQAVVQEVEIPLDALSEAGAIEFRCDDKPQWDGFTVYAAGVVLERTESEK
ncbi:MAG: hypothetical protein ACLFVY_02935 [Phycisphaerae bacterium]